MDYQKAWLKLLFQINNLPGDGKGKFQAMWQVTFGGNYSRAKFRLGNQKN